MSRWLVPRLAIAIGVIALLPGCPTGGGGGPSEEPGSTGIRIPSSYRIDLSAEGTTAHRLELRSPSVSTTNLFEIAITSIDETAVLGNLDIDTSQATGLTFTRSGSVVTIVQPEGAASIGTFRTVRTIGGTYAAPINSGTIVLNFSNQGSHVAGTVDATTADTSVPEGLRSYQTNFAGDRE